MTDEERSAEGAEEAIEDLEAPAQAQTDVAGGKGCQGFTCLKPTKGPLGCREPTCNATERLPCKASDVIVIG